MKTAYFKRLDRYPPVLIRLLARNPNGTAMDDAQIIKAGCPATTLGYLSCSTQWTLSAQECDAYLHACGADPLNVVWVKRVNRLTNPKRPTKWLWLQRSPHWPRFKELLKVYVCCKKNNS